ncbi:lamin tail domain-containing protein [Candidatus Bipolaricaulota bacterium]|nr:lamin tail domain-containing protein [Candidatus Bipolaricaulota bacterium]
MNRMVRGMALAMVVLILVGGAVLANGLMISEIAWAGTAASSTDEWIELKNAGSEAIDLAGWRLVFGDTEIPLGVVAEDTLEIRTTTLAPGAFFVLERTDDDTISDVIADLLYKGTLSNAGILVELINPDGVSVDSAVMDESGWPGGSGGSGEPAYCSMERTSSGNWVSNNAIICNGLDGNGVPLRGTPGQVNSADVLAQWAPRVEMTFPSEAGSILSGTEWISWIASDPNGTDSALAIAIFLSPNGEDEWDLLIENLANAGSFSWDTTTVPSANGYRLKVRATDPEGYMGEAVSLAFDVSNAGE